MPAVSTAPGRLHSDQDHMPRWGLGHYMISAIDISTCTEDGEGKTPIRVTAPCANRRPSEWLRPFRRRSSLMTLVHLAIVTGQCRPILRIVQASELGPG